MISRVSAILNTVTDFYKDINPSTLSGAIDIIVVEHVDKELSCSPFHVRFGKLQLLRAYEKVVETPVPHELATSPIPVPVESSSGDDELEPLDLNDGIAVAHVAAIKSDAAATEITGIVSVKPISPGISRTVSPTRLESNNIVIDNVSLLDDSKLSSTTDKQNVNANKIINSTNTPTSPIHHLSKINTLSSDIASEEAFVDSNQLAPYPNEHAAQTTLHLLHDTTEEIDGLHANVINSAGHASDDTSSDVFVEASADRDDEKENNELTVKVSESSYLQGTDKTPSPVSAQSFIGSSKSTEDNMSTAMISPAEGDFRRRSVSASPSRPLGFSGRKSLDHPFSDTESELKTNNRDDKSVNLLSGTELNHLNSESVKSSDRLSWGWGRFPSEGLTSHDNKLQAKPVSALPTDTEHSADMTIDLNAPELEIEMSVCGYGKDKSISEELFAKNRVSYEEFAQHTQQFMGSPDLVLRINKTYYPWSVASTILVSMFVYKQPLPRDVVQRMLFAPSTDNKKDDKRKYGFREGWRTWFGRSSTSPTKSINEGLSRITPSNLRTIEDRSSVSLHNENIPSSSTTASESNHLIPEKMLPSTKYTFSEQVPSPDSSPTFDARRKLERSLSESELTHKSTRRTYLKTLRLTSDQLKTLNLKKGVNTATFTVTSSLQGRAQCRARIYLWDESVNIVISDIDGTITKSDALGHLFTMVGRDWTHLGVAGLYTMISNNGYQFLFLTSRAIGQAQSTRNYLQKVEQNQHQLPDGPVFLSPDRLVAAFTREVIQRRPEEFKVACLKDVRSLFKERNPFHAGFGNRHTDALSYRAVGIPSSRIFTINHVGELKLELLEGYKSSYIKLLDLVDHIFPPVTRHIDSEYNDYNYWKPAYPDVPDEEIAAVLARNKQEEYDEEGHDYYGDEDDEEHDEDEERRRVVDFAAYPYI